MPAAAPIDPGHLIDHARDLAHHHIGPGSLRPVYMRRAASAAYYAFFHAMALRVSQQVLPNGSAEDRQRRSRSVGHAELRDVCQWIIGPSGAGKRHLQPIVATLQQDGRVVRIAGIAFRLQEERHRADYDHLATFGKARGPIAHQRSRVGAQRTGPPARQRGVRETHRTGGAPHKTRMSRQVGAAGSGAGGAGRPYVRDER